MENKVINLRNINDYRRLVRDGKNCIIEIKNINCPYYKKIEPYYVKHISKHARPYCKYAIYDITNEEITKDIENKITHVPAYLFYKDGQICKELTVQGNDFDSLKFSVGVYYKNFKK